MDSLSDDSYEEEEGEQLDEDAQVHIHDDFPFIEYSGHLSRAANGEEDENLHSGKMTMTAAKEWCAKEPKCLGFHHAGDPGEGPFEFFFKEYWHLSVEHEDIWTAYQKGDKIEHEAVPEGELPSSEISAEDVMKEFGHEISGEEPSHPDHGGEL